jgi:hypothetical protein
MLVQKVEQLQEENIIRSLIAADKQPEVPLFSTGQGFDKGEQVISLLLGHCNSFLSNSLYIKNLQVQTIHSRIVLASDSGFRSRMEEPIFDVRHK